jgi:tRNA(adenine34) deaminase
MAKTTLHHELPADVLAEHQRHMRAALDQGRLAAAEGNLPIGAVIVRDGQVVASGRNGIDSGKNDTRHAELAAIESIGPFLFEHKRQCTVYTTLEPCMMCLGAIINSGIDKIVFGVSDAWVGGLCLLPHGDYYRAKTASFTIVGGVLADESQAMLNEYVRRTGFRAHHSTEQS